MTIESELPLHGATRKQVLLLLSCLYACDRGAWVRQLEPPERVDLARIADQSQCIELLQCVDASLVRMSEREEQLKQADTNSEEELDWLNGRDAPALLGIAHSLQLAGFGARVLRYIGRHLDSVGLEGLDPSTAARVAGACCSLHS